MQTAARTNSFLINRFSFRRLAELQGEISHAGFYQQIASALIKGAFTKGGFIDLANSLVDLAEQAYFLREMEIVEQASQILLNLPLPHRYKCVAHYYQAFCIKRKGHFAEARALFERVAEESAFEYKARAIIAIGAVEFDSGNYESAASFCVEAGRAAIHNLEFDPLISFYASNMTALLRSIGGDHRGALDDLDKMVPFVHALSSKYPSVYYNYLNSLAVEFSELGRFEEARSACRITLASPYADVYPEYRETGNEIAIRGYRTSRSFVAYSQTTSKPENVLHLPERGDSFIAIESCLDPAHQPASVLNFEDWKKKMVKEPNGDPPNEDPSKKLDEREMLLRIIQLVSQPDRTENELESILKSVEKIVAKKKDKS